MASEAKGTGEMKSGSSSQTSSSPPVVASAAPSTALFDVAGVGELSGYKDSDVDSLWKGMDQLSGSGEGYLAAARWWNSVPDKYKAHVAKACVVFFDKPPRFIAAGFSRSKGGAKVDPANLVDDRLARYLPKIEGGYKEPTGSTVNPRAGWRGFTDVNLSMTRRVAKMLITEKATKYPAVSAWIDKYGGEFGNVKADSVGYKKVCADPRSKAIFDAHSADVLAYQKEWNKVFQWK